MILICKSLFSLFLYSIKRKINKTDRWRYVNFCSILISFSFVLDSCFGSFSPTTNPSWHANDIDTMNFSSFFLLLLLLFCEELFLDNNNNIFIDEFFSIFFQKKEKFLDIEKRISFFCCLAIQFLMNEKCSFLFEFLISNFKKWKTKKKSILMIQDNDVFRWLVWSHSHYGKRKIPIKNFQILFCSKIFFFFKKKKLLKYVKRE